jgi:energy-coupling factor transport system permease protein
LFRYLPGNSPIHNLWAGTKIIGLVLISISLSLVAGWWPFLVCALFIALVFLLSKLPLAVLKLLPGRILLLAVLLDLGFSFLAGGRPAIQIGKLHLMIGGFLNASEFIVASAEILLLIGLVSWTTSLAEIISSFSKIAGAFRKKSAFVEYLNTFALMIRAIPIVIEDLRVMVAALKLNGFSRGSIRDASSVREVFAGIYDFIHVALVTTLRRAQEIGVAMVARGGYNERVALESSVTKFDKIAFLILVFISASILTVGILS